MPKTQSTQRLEKIYFVKYKNLHPNTELIFPPQEEPYSDIIIFIGKNGAGKSSILHAVYGCCEGSVVSDFWFDTAIDKNDIQQVPDYWYEYYNQEIFQKYEKNPQVRQKRIYKGKSVKDMLPDYWESVRPTSKVNMNWTAIECQKTINKYRWQKINLKAKYIDFRHNITAFDSAIYGDNLFGEVERDSKAKSRIIKNSKYLKDNKSYYKRKISKSYELEKNVIERINKILDKNYSSIKIIYHNYYELTEKSNINRVTILINHKNINYSDAYAGTGESAIIQLVHQLTELKEPTIIILDEPESSLHITAQKNLMNFLKQESAARKHQIFISTHSPYIIEPDFISSDLVFKCSYSEENKVTVARIINKEEAFKEVGIDRTLGTILTEDKNIQTVINIILTDLDFHKNLEVQYLNGFSSFANRVFELGKRRLCIADYDKYKDKSTLLLYSDLTVLKKEFKRLSETENLPRNTNGKNEEEIKELYIEAIELFDKNVLYHPFKDIETFLMELTNPDRCHHTSKDAFREHMTTYYGRNFTLIQQESEIQRLMTTNKDTNAYKKMKKFVQGIVDRFKNR